MGYSKELFLNHVDDEFTCSICLNVLEDPVQVNNLNNMIFDFKLFNI
jgi:hypothetical protein